MVDSSSEQSRQEETAPSEPPPSQDASGPEQSKRPAYPTFTPLGTLIIAIALLIEVIPEDLKIVFAGIGLVIACAGFVIDSVRIRQTRHHRPLGLVMFLLVVLLLGIGIGLSIPTIQQWWADRFECPPPADLTVAVPLADADGFRELTHSYADAKADDHGCQTIAIELVTASWAEYREALATGWGEEALREVGPRPQIWISESSMQGAIIAEDIREKTESAGTDADSTFEIDLERYFDSNLIGWTELVLAVPADRKYDLPSGEDRLTLAETIVELEEQGIATVRADPFNSFAAQMHLQTLYETGSGPNATPALIERRITHTAAQNGMYSMNDADLLCQIRLRPEDAQPIAVLTTERLAIDYNFGKPLGGGCAGSTTPGESEWLSTVDDVTSRFLDYQFNIVDWSAVDLGEADVYTPPPHDGDVDSLHDWLQSEEGRSALNEMRIRNAAHDGQLPWDGIARFHPGSTFRVGDVAGYSDILDEDAFDELISTTYPSAKVPTRVLLAVDNSGTMKHLAEGTGRSRTEVASDAVRIAVSELNPTDEIGMSVFPGSGEVLEELIPIGQSEDSDALGGQFSEELLAHPHGDQTPLYDAILEGQSILEESGGDEAQSVLVVLTDGVDDNSTVTASELRQSLSNATIPVYILAIGESSCNGNGLDTISTAEPVTCHNTDFTALETTVGNLFAQLWGAL